jgi:glutathione S-transferase
MKLYMNKLSPNVRRVRIVAAAAGIELEEQSLDFAKGEHKSPEYLAINPNGAVPALVDGDFILTESRAMMQYLAAKKPESRLLPSDEAERADVTRWQFWDASHFSPNAATIAFERLLKPMMGLGEPDTSKINVAVTNWRRFAAVLEKRLDGRTFIVGNALTIADLTLASSLMYAKQSELPLADFPRLAAWFGRISELEAWKKTNP